MIKKIVAEEDEEEEVDTAMSASGALAAYQSAGRVAPMPAAAATASMSTSSSAPRKRRTRDSDDESDCYNQQESDEESTPSPMKKPALTPSPPSAHEGNPNCFMVSAACMQGNFPALLFGVSSPHSQRVRVRCV